MKVIFKSIVYLIFVLFSVVLLLELAYRLQVVEFYGPELSALNDENSQVNKTAERKKVLVLGDSFSASGNNYVDHLRKEYPECFFLNAAIPGTGIRQDKIILKKRTRDFHPDILIYQFYVGNDLTDIIHPWNTENVSLLRSAYWRLSENILILPYLNSKLSFLRVQKRSVKLNDISSRSFDVNTYNARTRMYINLLPEVYLNSIFLHNQFDKHYELWNESFLEIKNMLPTNCKVYILMIPHCIQVHETYLNNFNELGATTSEVMIKTNYPLIINIRDDHTDVTVLDPQTYFQEATKPDSIYYSDDPHLSIYGQKVLYQFLAEQLIF